MFKTEYIYARILFPFIIGILVFYFFQIEILLNWLIGFSLVIFGILIILNLTYKKTKGYRFKGIAGILIHVFFFTFGGSLCLLISEQLKPNHFSKKKYSYLKVWVRDEP